MDNTVEYNGYKLLQLYKPYNKEQVDKNNELVKECKFVRHMEKTERNADTHFISLVHHDDANKIDYKELKVVTNYKRPVWVTKKLYRNHKDKKEFEHIDKLQLITTPQSDIDLAVCRGLEVQPSDYNKRNIKDSPYLYGYDIPSVSYISYFYKMGNGGLITPYKILNMDIEADTEELKDVTVFTMSTPGFRHTAVVRRLFDRFKMSDEEIIAKIKSLSKELLPETEALKQCKIYDVSIHDNDLDLLKFVFGMAHKMMPDICTFHNMVYDLSKIIERMEHHKYDVGDLLSDPAIPKHLRNITFTPGKQYKIKKGVKTSVPMEDQWTTIDIPATFMIMDTMTMYSAIRQAQGKLLGGYGLDNILEKNKLAGKLLYEDENTKYMTKLEWHRYMSKQKPFEYVIYAEQDTLGMTDLELKTQDFSMSLPIFAGICDFNRYNSSVHKATTKAYLENRHKGLIVGTTPRNPIDRTYLGTDDWIKTLSSDFIQDIGLRITNLPYLPTNVTAHAEDQDCVSSYPSDIQAMNVSIGTLRAELVNVKGYDKSFFKNNNINLVSSNSNIIEYCNNMMNMPKAVEMLEEARRIYNKAA